MNKRTNLPFHSKFDLQYELNVNVVSSSLSLYFLLSLSLSVTVSVSPSNSLVEYFLTEGESLCGSVCMCVQLHKIQWINEHKELNRAARCHGAVPGRKVNSPWLPANGDVKS